MIEVGDWVEGDNGYGVIVKIFPEYYNYWDDDLPDDKKPGDKNQDSVIIKRFCSFDFKVYPQTQTNSMESVSKVTKKDMKKINSLLKDEKTAKRFESYNVHDDICEIVNWDQKLSKESIKLIRKGLENLKNNGTLNMTMREIEAYIKNEFDIDLIDDSKFIPNCYIQLTTIGLGVYKDKELLFKQIGITEK